MSTQEVRGICTCCHAEVPCYKSCDLDEQGNKILFWAATDHLFPKSNVVCSGGHQAVQAVLGGTSDKLATSVDSFMADLED